MPIYLWEQAHEEFSSFNLIMLREEFKGEKGAQSCMGKN